MSEEPVTTFVLFEQTATSCDALKKGASRTLTGTLLGPECSPDCLLLQKIILQ